LKDFNRLAREKQKSQSYSRGGHAAKFLSEPARPRANLPANRIATREERMPAKGINTVWLGALIAAACIGSGSAYAQTFPSKTITFIVPAAPGGVTDVLARTLAQRFTQAWGQQAVVENKPGANNQIAAEYVTKAAPDGHTLLIGPEVTFTVNPALYGKLNYDPIDGFTSIVGLVSVNHALITHPSLPASNVKELIALAKQKPGALDYGTFGAGSTGHLNMELFQSLAGIKLQAVHYRGATPALTDVIAGHIKMMYISVGSALPQARDNKVKLLAHGGAKRMALLPDIPTVAEAAGLPGYEAISWFGLFGPPKMPTEVVTKINAEVQKLFADPEVRKNVIDHYYFESLAGTPQQLADRIKADAPKWRKVIEEAHVKPE
jgi:tripartite-type tricarboxylate transporter receptor subunit TctC